MYPAKYKITLRITHPSMDAEDIAIQLGLQASRRWSAGSRRTTPTGTLLSGVNDVTFCMFELEVPMEMIGDLGSALSLWTKKLFAAKSFFDHIRSTGGTIEYFIGVFMEKGNTGVVMEVSLMNQLVELGIGLSLDIYESQHVEQEATRRT
jgi:hypothetical protein